ncbi:hypothetical protein Emed_003326 [Eimeria media]
MLRLKQDFLVAPHLPGGQRGRLQPAVGPSFNVLALDNHDASSACELTQPTEESVQQTNALPSLMSQTLRRTEALPACEKAAHPLLHAISSDSTSSGVTCCADREAEARRVLEATHTPREGGSDEATTASAASREHRRSQPSKRPEVINSPEVLQETAEAIGDAGTVAAPKDARERKDDSKMRQNEAAAPAASLHSVSGSVKKPKSRGSRVAAASGAVGASAATAAEATVVEPPVSLPVVPACSGCSLNSATAWRKWLQLLSETDPHRRQQLLLQDFPACKRRHAKEASGSGHAVVDFQRLSQLLDAAALHPHATADAVAVLRQRVRLGVTSPALLASDTTAVKAATKLPVTAALETSIEEGECAESVATEAASLSYVEHGLSTLALERGAQLLQSLRDFDCADSFLLEASGACAPPRVGFAPPRWSFRVLEGPLNVQANRQKIKTERMEAGTLLILKPVDQKSAALARELRRIHGKSFDFSFVSAHGHIGSVGGLPLGVGCASHVNRDGTNTQELLQQAAGELQRIRCSMCGKWLFYSAEELLQPRLRCPDCGGTATEVLATASMQSPSGSADLEVKSQVFPRSKCIDTRGLSQDRSWRGDAGDTLGDLQHVLQELEAAAAWTGYRFALPAPAFIASVCSQGSKKTLKVRVSPLLSSPACSNIESSNGSPLQSAATADVQHQGQQQGQQKVLSMRDLEFTTGSQFWAMPVSFIEAVHARQVDALARLANVSLPAHRPTKASSKDTHPPSSPMCDNHILRVLTASPNTLKSALEDDTATVGKDIAAVDDKSVLGEKHQSHAITGVSSMAGFPSAEPFSSTFIVGAIVWCGVFAQFTGFGVARYSISEFAGLLALVHGADVAVLIGDEKQLPPASVLPPSTAPRSLFSALKGYACRSVLLNHQFRMPPLIAAFISAHFYEGKLLTHPSKAALPQLPHLPSPQKEQSVPAALDAFTSARVLGDGGCIVPSSKAIASRSARNAAGDVCKAGSQDASKGSTFAVEATGPSKAALTGNNTSSTPNFPWPDSSEGDKDLALRLLQQLQKASGQVEDGAAISSASQVTHETLPPLLPVLFIDTSPWASGQSKKLARLCISPAALGKPAPTSADACSASDVLASETVEEDSVVLRSLPAEQRVKGSLQNSLEAFLVYRCVKALLRDGISQKDIAVLTPYQAQAQLLSRVLHPAELTDKAQGQLHRSGRLSFVQPVSSNRRSPNEFFLFDPRRINVALSRASRGLIIVGSAQALTDASPTWASFLLFLRSLGAALPLDHPSLRASLTNDLLLPRPTEAHRGLKASAVVDYWASRGYQIDAAESFYVLWRFL